MAEDRFDGLFLTLAQQSQGIEPLLENLFSFLRRKSDFFSGASPEKVEEIVLNVLRKHATLAERDNIQKKQAKEKEEKLKKERLEKKKQEEEAKKRATKTEPAKAPIEEDVIELGEDGSFDVSHAPPKKVSPEVKADTSSSTDKAPTDSTEKSEDDTTKEEEDKSPPRKYS